MQLNDFRKLLLQGEGPTLDYKRELYLDAFPRSPSEERITGALDKKRRGEFVKDAMALANAFSHWGSPRYLIVGVDDEGQLVGIEPGTIDEQQVARALTDYCTPPLQFLYEEIQLGGMWFGVITIPDSPLKPHKFSTDVHYVSQRATGRGLKSQTVHAYHKDDVWLRVGSHSKKASPEEIIQIRRDAGRITLLPHSSERLPISLRETLCDEAPELFDRILGLRRQSQERYIPRFPPWVEDSATHYQTIVEKLDKLVPMPMMQAMTCQELFVLLGSVELHEIGMATDSHDSETLDALLDTFHSRTRQTILQKHEDLELSRPEANAMGYVCYAHRGEGILDVPELVQIGTPLQTIRLQFLAALFRLAHALDLEQKLAVLFRNEGMACPGDRGLLRIAIEPNFWELRVECTPRDVKEEELSRRAVESAQKELDRIRIFLHKHGLNYHTIRLNVDTSLYELDTPVPMLSINPYRGLASFTEADADLFFGRDEDVNNLLGKVCSYDLVTLLGESGIGKTSLLRAGLTPKLERLRYHVVYTRGYDDPEQRIREAVCRHIPEARALEDESFVGFLLTFSSLKPRTVLLLDQAEEIFTRVPEETRQRFVKDLASLTSDRRFEIKLVLSIRQDYAHHLFDISKDIPSLYRRECISRLARLSARDVREALATPIHGIVTIADEVLDRVLEDLQVGGLYYPPDVQIVGYQLFEKRNKEQGIISLHEYQALGSAEGIIGDYFFCLIEDYAPHHRELARDVLKLLVTSFETKNQFTIEEISGSLALQDSNALPGMLDRLVNDRLVSRIPEQRYELVHDYLAAQIRVRWITEVELEVKKLREMLRGWVREWQELGGGGFEHLLDTYRLKQLREHAYELHPSKKESELIITSAVRYGAEVAPWLEQLDSETAVETLAQLLAGGRADIQIRAIEALGMTRSVKAIRHLDLVLRDDNKEIQKAAIGALTNIPSQKAAIPLQYALKRERDLVRAAPIIYALEMMRTDTAIEALRQAATTHTNKHVSARASEALGRVERGKLIAVLVDSLGSEDANKRFGAIASLERVYSKDVSVQLQTNLKSGDESTRLGILEALEYLDLERSIESIISTALTDDSVRVRSHAVKALAGVKTARAVEALLQVVLEDNAMQICEEGIELLRKGRFGERDEPFFQYLAAIWGIPELASLADESPQIRRGATQELAQLGDSRVIGPLLVALSDQDSVVQRLVARALRESGYSRHVYFLISRLRNSDPHVRKEAAKTLGQLGDDRAIDGLILALKDEDLSVRRQAAESLGELKSEKAELPLLRSLEDKEPTVRIAGLEALERLGYERSIDSLIVVLEDQDPAVARKAADVLVNLCATRLLRRPGDEDAIESLITLLENENVEVRREAAQVLGLGGEQVVEPLVAALDDEDPLVRRRAAETLGELRDEKAVMPLVNALQDEAPPVRQTAADALGRIGDERAKDPLKTALSDEDWTVRRSVASALGHMGCEIGIPPGEAEAGKIPIEDLLPSARLCNTLRRAGITTVGAVLEKLSKGDAEILSIRNFGRRSLAELRETLQARGIATIPAGEDEPVHETRYACDEKDVTYEDVDESVEGREESAELVGELETELVPPYEAYADYKGKVVEGSVKSLEDNNVLISWESASDWRSVQHVAHGLHKERILHPWKIEEALLPPREQIPGERYYPGLHLWLYVRDLRRDARALQFTVSRIHPEIVRHLLELHVPEVRSGAVEIKAIAREAGSRTKVAVTSLLDGLDPVGSCVGVRAERIKQVVTALGGEKIDVVLWDPNLADFVAHALSPAKVQSVHVDDDNGGKVACVIVPDRQLSLAIGKEGQNARLAAKLTGCRIDIKGVMPEPPPEE